MFKFQSKWKGSVFAWQWQKECSGPVEEGLEERRNIKIYSVMETAIQPYCIQYKNTAKSYILHCFVQQSQQKFSFYIYFTEIASFIYTDTC